MEKNVKDTPEQLKANKEMVERQLEDFTMKKSLLSAISRDYDAFIQQIQMVLDNITKTEESKA